MPRLPSQLTYNDLHGGEMIDVLTDWFRQLLQSQSFLQPHLTLPMAKVTLDIGIAIDMYIGGTLPVSSPPERLDITGAVTVDHCLSNIGTDSAMATALRKQAPEHIEHKLSTVINAAPIPGGVPPDQIREQHDLPVPRPGYGPRETGSHLFLSDVVDSTNERLARQGVVAEGYVFSNEQPSVQEQQQTIPVDQGSIEIDLSGTGRMRQGDMTITAGSHVASKKTAGDQAGSKYGTVTGTYDPGPAGLGRPGHGGGLYGDGRSRISFGNNHKG